MASLLGGEFAHRGLFCGLSGGRNAENTAKRCHQQAGFQVKAGKHTEKSFFDIDETDYFCGVQYETVGKIKQFLPLLNLVLPGQSFGAVRNDEYRLMVGAAHFAKCLAYYENHYLTLPVEWFMIRRYGSYGSKEKP
ncbi:hypothetical protein [Serratia liquefaciens]|uniref:hypothetical protein n=1 Tax=Serratia liquefaciens TaxID=614 RepID=UPI00215850DF|nr:hypothetical protein [Serratia liquefaciens]